MADKQLPVEYIFTVTLEGLNEDGYNYAGPFGDRAFQRASGGSFSGPKMSGEVLKLLSTDYGRISNDGKLRHYESSVTLLTNDDTAILFQYRGRQSEFYGPGQSRIQAMFQVEEGPYGWLNGIQAIGTGRQEGDKTVFDVYVLTGAPETEGLADISVGADRKSFSAEFLFRRKSDWTPGGKRHVITSPLGRRYFTLAEGGGIFEGPNIKGRFLPGYSWSPHRTGTLEGESLLQYDVQTLLRSDDGAPVLMSYTGTSSKYYPKGVWVTGVLFEVPRDSPHAVLNQVQAVGCGRWAGDGAEYHVYALR